ncbi:hypothetical protein ES705_28245 [subsurface metagenome]
MPSPFQVNTLQQALVDYIILWDPDKAKAGGPE